MVYTIRFNAIIKTSTINELLQKIDDAIYNKADRINIFIDSGGGYVSEAIRAYNYIQDINNRKDSNICLYNVGTVYSAAVVLFCAGNERIALKNSTFLIHPITITLETPQDTTTITYQELEDYIKQIDTSYQRYASIVSKTTQKEEEEIMKDMKSTLQITSQEALKYGAKGLVTKLEDDIDKIIVNETIFSSDLKQTSTAKTSNCEANTTIGIALSHPIAHTTSI
jgi:ATP-dependent protease ClpP protease subunit